MKSLYSTLQQLDAAAKVLDTAGMTSESQSITDVIVRLAKAIESVNPQALLELSERLMSSFSGSADSRKQVASLLSDFNWGLEDKLYPYCSNKLVELEVLLMDSDVVPDSFDELCKAYRMYKKHNPSVEET